MNEETECTGRGPMDTARMLAKDDPAAFNDAVSAVFEMIEERCLIPCPVHQGKYVISLKWAREHNEMGRVPEEPVILETPCFSKQIAR